MILIDHNVPEHQVVQLQRWGVHCQKIGRDVGREEWQDLDEILRYLHRGRQHTFITRDAGFFRRRLCHANYCIVVIIGPVEETAEYVRRFLRHPSFRTKRQRMGKVVRLSPDKITWWELHAARQQRIAW